MLEELQQTLCSLPETAKSFVVLELDENTFCPIKKENKIEISTDPEITIEENIYEVNQSFLALEQLYTTKSKIINFFIMN